MAEEQIIKLLEEIRDLQQESIKMRRRLLRRQIPSLFILIGFLACILIWLFFFSSKA
jgi:hypothetical protein